MFQQPDIKQIENQNPNPSPSEAPHAVSNVDPKAELESETNVCRGGRTMDKEEIQRIKSENSVRKLPRKAKIGGNTFFVSYSHLIYSGRYTIHHAVRTPDKELFSLKIDDRNPAMVLRDETIRSKLVGVDLPKIMLSERKNSITFHVMEPLSLTFKNLIRGFSIKRENRLYNSGILLRIGRMCVRLLKRIHDNGILHGNVNPHTFVLPCNHDGEDVKPDFKRGPLILDFSHAINTKEDILYKEVAPEKRFNSAIHSKDGGIYTKRDDMENLGYVLLFLANGRISWEVRKRRDLLLFGKKCLSELERKLKGIPSVIKNYLTYVRTIKWNDTPDYKLLDSCLTSKSFDIRSEIKARRERLRLKRKREPSARSRSLRITNGESVLKAHREQANNTSKRHQVQKSFAFQDNSVPSESEPEYIMMSLQLLPDIAVKFSVPEEDFADTHNSRTVRDNFALDKVDAKELEEELKYGTQDEPFAKLTANNVLKSFEDKHFSISGNDGALGVTADDLSDSNSDAEHQNQFTGNLRTMHRTSKHHQEHTHSVRTRTPGAIQFYFPSLASENEDRLKHPWDDELGF